MMSNKKEPHTITTGQSPKGGQDRMIHRKFVNDLSPFTWHKPSHVTNHVGRRFTTRFTPFTSTENAKFYAFLNQKAGGDFVMKGSVTA